MLSLDLSPGTLSLRRRGAAPVGPRPAVFDFSGGQMPPGLSFARASHATGDAGAGLLADFAPDAPRLLPGAVAPGLLTEPARRNLLPQSQGPAASWSASSAVLSDLSLNAMGRFGGLSVAGTGASWNRALRNLPMTGGTAYVLTAFVRPGSSGRILVMCKNGSSGRSSEVSGAFSALSASDGGAGPITLLTSEALSDGVTRRVSLAFTPNASATHSIGIGPASSVAGETVILLGVQLEEGPFATAYIPTGASTAARAPEVLTTGLPAGAYLVEALGSDGGSESFGPVMLAAGEWPALITRQIRRLTLTPV